MFKLIRTLFSSVFFVFLLIFGYGWIQKESFAERILQEAIGSPITVGKIRMHRKGLTLKHVYIYNPVQSDIFPYAFEAESVKLDIAFFKLIFRIPELENVTVTKGCLNILLPSRFSKDSNWSIIFNNLKRYPASFVFGMKHCNFYDIRIQSLKPGMKDLQSLYFKNLSFHYSGHHSRQHLSMSDALGCLFYLPLQEASQANPQIKSFLHDIHMPDVKTFTSFGSSSISFPEQLHFQQESIVHHIPPRNDSSKEETIEFLNSFFFR